MDLKDRFSKLLKDNNVTPYFVSDRTGISQATLSRIVNGNTIKISIKTSKILANYFNVSQEWLLTGKGSTCLNQNEQNLSDPHPLPTSQKTGLQVKDSNKNISVQENQQIIDKLLQRLESQSKEIGRLEEKIDYLSALLAEKNTMQENARHAKAG